MSENTEQQLPPPLGEHYTQVTKPCDICSKENKRLAIFTTVGGVLLGLSFAHLYLDLVQLVR